MDVNRDMLNLQFIIVLIIGMVVFHQQVTVWIQMLLLNFMYMK